MRILIVGCGYVGHRAALDWRDQGFTVTALTRSEERAVEFAADGIIPIIGDVLDPESIKQLPEADVCLYAVGYDRSAEPDKRNVYVNGLGQVLNEIHHRIPRLIYLSSSSVYGQDAGEQIDESSPCNPTSDGGKICLDAESIVQEYYPDQKSVTILRLSGIYGPGRLIGRRQQLADQMPISGNPQAWLNLVHVDDIVQAINLLVKSRPSSKLYLLSDGNPIRRIEFYSTFANKLGLPAPVMPETANGRFGKRCDPSRILRELSLQLKYPTIDQGLDASFP